MVNQSNGCLLILFLNIVTRISPTALLLSSDCAKLSLIFRLFPLPLVWNSLALILLHGLHVVTYVSFQLPRHALCILFSCNSIARLCPNSSQPHELQHTRLLSLSLSLGACSDLCPLSQWCHLTVSSSLTLFSSCIFPSIRVFSSESSPHQVAKALELQLQHQSF